MGGGGVICHVPCTPSSKKKRCINSLIFIAQVLEENRRQGEEDQALEKRVEGKKAAAKKRATRRSACFRSLFSPTVSALY